MSKTETTATVKPIKKTYTYFDLNKFEKVSEEREIPPFVPKSSDEVLAIVAADNDILTKAVNAYLKRAELRKIKLEVASKGGDTSIVMALAKPFRAMPPWNGMYELNTDGTPKTDEKGEKVVDRAAQTKSILDFIKSNPALVASIKQATIDAANAEEDEDGEEKKDED